MKRCWVFLGYFGFLLKSEISSYETFISQKLGGPDRDRTDDLLHAMQSGIKSALIKNTLQISDFTSKCSRWFTPGGISISAHTCSIMKAKAGDSGGKIGVSHWPERIRFWIAHNRPASEESIIPSARSSANLTSHSDFTSRQLNGGNSVEEAAH